MIVIKIIFKFINIFMIIFLTKSIEKLLPIHDFSLKYDQKIAFLPKKHGKVPVLLERTFCRRTFFLRGLLRLFEEETLIDILLILPSVHLHIYDHYSLF